MLALTDFAHFFRFGHPVQKLSSEIFRPRWNLCLRVRWCREFEQRNQMRAVGKAQVALSCQVYATALRYMQTDRHALHCRAR